ncbi:MAG TPA: hypothetical protein VN969_00495 [Streptosporangiaceae bacterium]|jgi:hypothetical protein|nr:hypothetical protein [Streptosporangiaceae bacterium]
MVKRFKRPLLLAPVLAVGLAAGCGSSSSGGSSAASPARAVSPASGSPAGRPAAPVRRVLTCSTVLDPHGYDNGPLTTNTAIGYLTYLQLTRWAANIPKGTPGETDINILVTMAGELENYSGSSLSTDAEQFVLDEQGYNPDGPIAVSYAQPLKNDISALMRDCPDGAKLGLNWHNEGSS